MILWEQMWMLLWVAYEFLDSDHITVMVELTARNMGIVLYAHLLKRKLSEPITSPLYEL